MLPHQLEQSRRVLTDVVEHIIATMQRGLTDTDLPHLDQLERVRELLTDITTPLPFGNFHAFYTHDRYLDSLDATDVETALGAYPTGTVLQDGDNRVWRKHTHHSTPDAVWSAATSGPSYHNRSSRDLRALRPFRILYNPITDPGVRDSLTEQE